MIPHFLFYILWLGFGFSNFDLFNELRLFNLAFSISDSELSRLSQNKTVIKGRVVDVNGRSIPNAKITLQVAPESDLIVFVLTDKDGNFMYEIDLQTGKSKKHVEKLFVTPPLPNGTCAFIGPPYHDTPLDFSLRQTGREIVIRGGETLDVGDITPSLRYVVAELTLMDKNNLPLLLHRQDWEKTWVRIRDNKGNTISTSTIAKSKISEAVNLSKGSILLAMPEGHWSIEFKTPHNQWAWSEPLMLPLLGTVTVREKITWR